MPLRALIFDVDGTLAETEEAHRTAFNEAFANHGLDWHWDRDTYGDLLKVAGGRERIRHFMARSSPELLARADADELVRRLHTDKTARYQRRLAQGQIVLRPGVARLLAEAHADPGVRLALATTTHVGNIEALLTPALGGHAIEWFDAIAAGDHVAAKKPAPDLYLHALEQLGLAGAECLAIEDAAIGLAAATAAKIPTVVTVNAYTCDEAFPDAVAVLSDLGEPGCPFAVLAGDAHGRLMVDLDLLRRWHAEVNG
jgi:beta-phosphoglucomutase-like phosphatase (HAD superfamily)